MLAVSLLSFFITIGLKLGLFTVILSHLLFTLPFVVMIIFARLRTPRRFTDALLAPWRGDAPAAGSQRFAVHAPTFLPANLIPPGSGARTMRRSGTYFSEGAWSLLSGESYGPDLRRWLVERLGLIDC